MDKFSTYKFNEGYKAHLNHNNDELKSTYTPVYNEESSVVKFLRVIFASRDITHIYHLQVNGENGSNALHKALDEYYNNIIELFDKFVEIYQGQYGLVDGYKILDGSDINYKDKTVIQYLEELVDYVKVNRKIFSDSDNHLHSLIDDIVNQIYHTLYFLKYCK